MSLGTFVAGRYSATYDPPGGTAATDMGTMSDGYEISARVAKELIGETDQYGQMVVDAIYRGIADVFIQGTAIEWKTGVLLAATPYQAMAATGSTYFGPGTIARLDTDVCGVIILTATSSTPAASSPATMTATYSILAENFDVRWALTSKLRKMPLRFRVYPYLDTAIKFFTAT